MTYAQYPAVIYKDEEGVCQVSFPDFPGCFTFGYTYEEAEKMAEEALQLWIETLKDNNELKSFKNSKTIISQIPVAV